MSVFSVSVTVTVTDWVGRPVTGAAVNPMTTRSGRLRPSRVDQFRESAPAAAAPLHGRPLRKGVSSGSGGVGGAQGDSAMGCRRRRLHDCRSHLKHSMVRCRCQPEQGLLSKVAAVPLLLQVRLQRGECLSV